MATLVTDPQARTIMSLMDFSRLKQFHVAITPTTIIYDDAQGSHVDFFGTGITGLPNSIPTTLSITGYNGVISGITTQVVTGLDLGPGELETLLMSNFVLGMRTPERLFHSNDYLYGGNFADGLVGFSGSDFIYGGAGDDTLVGDFGFPQQSGVPGDDFIYGGAGFDDLKGDEGNDHLYGGKDTDFLYGGSGADFLIGGQGTDTMTGGDGADRFVFNNRKETVVGSRHDEIGDFARRQDKIDLHGIDAVVSVARNQAFHFIGKIEFSGHEGELRYRVEKFSKTEKTAFVEGDTNGDGHADFEIAVFNLGKLGKTDFIL